jgi:HAD superfamily hydrolase (TIGR01509 family)
MLISSVILDFDGTIVDTETPTFEVWRSIYQRYGLVLEFDLWQTAVGTRTGFDPWLPLGDLIPDGDVAARLSEEVEQLIHSRCAQQTLRPGVLAWLGEACAAKLKTAVVSSSSAAWVEGWLAHHGIEDRFDCVLCCDHVEHAKPAPDLYLLAARELEAEPGTCIVLEDSPNGVQAACSAGMRCIAVPNELTRSLRFPRTDLVLSSLADATLGEVICRLGANCTP